MSRVYETNLSKLLYLRFREGYTIKNIQWRTDEFERIIIKMSLSWKPQILIEYIINALWSYDLEKKFVLTFVLLFKVFIKKKFLILGLKFLLTFLLMQFLVQQLNY